jgi:hypothetical protein
MTVQAKLLGVVLLLTAAAPAAMTVAACDDSSGNAVKETAPAKDAGASQVDSGSPASDGGPLPDGAPGDCVQNPQTHEEIINGCTDAVKITKNPNLPLLAADGGLPPLP